MGVVTEVGSGVQKFKVGDKVGVGYMVGACHSCDSCDNHLENYCPKMILTYGAKYYDGTITYGGYSDTMVSDEHFVVRIPDVRNTKGFVLYFHNEKIYISALYRRHKCAVQVKCSTSISVLYK